MLYPTCAFPHCTRASAAADLDHITPWQTGPHGQPTGGATDSHNLAPLCRLHHRAKTHGGWTYTRLTTAEYLWTSPHGYQFHVTTHGTTDITHNTHPKTPGHDRSDHENACATGRSATDTHRDSDGADPPGRPTPRP